MDNITPKASSKQVIFSTGERFPDGTMIEMIYDPRKRQGQFVLARNGSIEIVDHYTDDESEITYRPLVTKGIEKGHYLLPSGLGNDFTPSELFDRVLSFLDRYIDLDPNELKVCASYIIMTYVYDAFEKIGYLRAIGSFGSGKSRFLTIHQALCRNSMNQGSAQTPASLFRSLGVYGTGTMVIDEANYEHSDKTNDMTKILLAGNSRDGCVIRCNPKTYDPEDYPVFSPKIIANHALFEDEALESRMLTMQMHQTTRKDIPERRIPEFQSWKEADELRNDLLCYRLNYYHIITEHQPRYSGLDKYDPRTREIVSPLLWAQMLDDVPAYIISYLNRSIDRNNQARLDTEEGYVALTIWTYLKKSSKPIKGTELTDMIKQVTNHDISGRRLGTILGNLHVSGKRISACMLYDLTTVDTQMLKNRYGLD